MTLQAASPPPFASPFVRIGVMFRMAGCSRTRLTARIARAYVAGQALAPADLAGLIAAVDVGLARAARDAPGAAPLAHHAPAAPIETSVSEHYLICLEDGRRFCSLKRHLRVVYGLSPEDYRARWGLPDDYPMVAPGYAAHRSALAKAIGLGRANVRTGAVTWDGQGRVRVA